MNVRRDELYKLLVQKSESLAASPSDDVHYVVVALLDNTVVSPGSGALEKSFVSGSSAKLERALYPVLFMPRTKTTPDEGRDVVPEATTTMLGGNGLDGK